MGNFITQELGFITSWLVMGKLLYSAPVTQNKFRQSDKQTLFVKSVTVGVRTE